MKSFQVIREIHRLELLVHPKARKAKLGSFERGSISLDRKRVCPARMRYGLISRGSWTAVYIYIHIGVGNFGVGRAA